MGLGVGGLLYWGGESAMCDMQGDGDGETVGASLFPRSPEEQYLYFCVG